MYNLFLLPLLLALTSLSLALTASNAQQHITSPSGLHQILVSLVRQHFSSHETHPTHQLSSHIYEHTIETNEVISVHGRLSVDEVCPKRIAASLAQRYIVNGEEIKHTQGPVVRLGEGYVFIYDYKTGNLLGGWGPRMYLKPLHFKRYPSLFVNIHHEEHEATSNSIHAPSTPFANNALHTSTRQFTAENNSDETQGHFRPEWRAERFIFFDVGLAFDSSFCSQYTDDPSASTTLVHGIGVAAHQMSLTRIVSLRIGDIVGFCSVTKNTADNTTIATNNDVFGPPPPDRMRWCESDKFCTIPDLRLRHFREQWRAYINNSLSDAVYLLTLSKPIKKNDIVGAAWVASACSDFCYGWVLGDHPVILAHEMGHTLGAPHSEEGLMRPFLSLGETSQYIGKSLTSIDNFIARLSGQTCLQPRHQGNSNERRFTGFTRIVKANLDGAITEGTDIATGTVRLFGQVLVVMMQAMRYRRGNVGLEMRITSLSRSSEKGFPFTYNNTYSKEYVKTSFSLDFKAGAGVAIASLKNEHLDDVIAVMVQKKSNKLYYIIGYDIQYGQKLIVNGGWSRGMIVPFNYEGDMIALGSTAGNMRGNGETDLVISYIEYNNNTSTNTSTSTITPKYIIGYDMNGFSAMASRGWSEPVEIPIPNHLKLPTAIEDIGDISVTFWHKPSLNTSIPSTMSLLFSITSRKANTRQWKTIVCVAENAHRFRKWNSKPWKKINCYVPNIKSIFPRRLTGGIALTRLLSSTSPVATSIVYQNRLFGSGSSSQWLDVGDGILTKQKAMNPAQPKLLALSIGEDVIPSDTCSRCYNAEHVNTCKQRVRSCFARRAFGKLEKVLAKSIVRQQVSNNIQTSSSRQTNGEISPSSGAIFCAGFHSIFIVQRNSQNNENSKCGWDSKRTSIIAEGVRVLLLEDITPTQEVEGTVVVEKGEIPEDLKFILGSGGFGSNFVPTHVQVTVFSNRELRWLLLNKAMSKIRNRPDFNSFFSDSRKDANIIRKGGKKYIVELKIKEEYQAEWLQDVAAGRAHD